MEDPGGFRTPVVHAEINRGAMDPEEEARAAAAAAIAAEQARVRGDINADLDKEVGKEAKIEEEEAELVGQ